MVTGVFVNLLFEISFNVFFFAPIATGKFFAVGITEFVDKSLKKIPHRCNGLFSLSIFDVWRAGGILAAEITEIDSSPKKDAANRFS